MPFFVKNSPWTFTTRPHDSLYFRVELDRSCDEIFPPMQRHLIWGAIASSLCTWCTDRMWKLVSRCKQDPVWWCTSKRRRQGLQRAVTKIRDGRLTLRHENYSKQTNTSNTWHNDVMMTADDCILLSAHFQESHAAGGKLLRSHNCRCTAPETVMMIGR